MIARLFPPHPHPSPIPLIHGRSLSCVLQRVFTASTSILLRPRSRTRRLHPSPSAYLSIHPFSILRTLPVVSNPDCLTEQLGQFYAYWYVNADPPGGSCWPRGEVRFHSANPSRLRFRRRRTCREEERFPSLLPPRGVPFALKERRGIQRVQLANRI